MGNNKRYYWLKLKTDFFGQKEIKKLRKIAGGDTYTIIYLKLQLLSLKNEGILIFEGTEENICEQLSIEIDEEVNNVDITLKFLQANKLIESLDENEFLLTEVGKCIGSETQVAERVRKLRNNKKTLQCNTNVTKCNTEIEIEKELEIDIEKEKRIDTNKFVEKWNSLGLNKVLSIKNNRLKSLKARIEEFGEDKVLEAISNITQSSFLKGENDRGWKIDIDWLLKPNNFPKVLEGNYKDSPKSQKGIGFNNFKPRDYDYDSLEKKLLGWDEK